MKKDKHKPTNDDLRKFSLIVGGVLAAIFGGLIPYLNRGTWNPILVYVGIGIIAVGLLAPKLMYYPHKSWMSLGEILGWINTRIILSVIFFLLFTPIGLLKKIFGTDALRRKLDPKVDTYRIQCTERATDHMERPF